MGTMTSQITSLTILYSIVHSGADQRKQLRVTAFCAGNSPVTGEFPAQRASNAENVSIWWRHHMECSSKIGLYLCKETTIMVDVILLEYPDCSTYLVSSHH